LNLLREGVKTNMVKIRELSDSQLLSQIEKYEKIYHQLMEERNKRLGRESQSSGLLTKREEQLERQKQEGRGEESKESTQAYQLKLDDSEIEEINEAQRASTVEGLGYDEDDEVRVTQLLRLSQEDLAELKANKNTKKILKKKIRKKIKKS